MELQPFRSPLTTMPSPSPTRQPPSLLPSLFTHSDEPTSPSHQSLQPEPVLATTASIYSPDENPLNLPPRHHDPYDEEGDGGEDDGYPELRDEDGASLLPPPDFHPFFTLITDSRSGETYHPRTYYIFSDDDPDVLTTATLHALDAQSSKQFPEGRGQEGQVEEEDRYLIVDMSADGTKVQDIKSLAEKWAVTGAEVRGAPTFQQEGGAVGEPVGKGAEGLMLMIEGLGMDVPEKGKTVGEMERKQRAREVFEEARGRRGGNVLKGMEELASGMGSGLGILDKIVGGVE